MRHLAVILLLTFSATFSGFAQQCENVYFPLEEGASYTLHHYKANGKLLAKFTHQVLSIADSSGEKVATVQVQGATKRSDVYFEGEYKVGCYTDVFIAGLLSWYYDPLWKKYADSERQLSAGRVILMNEEPGSELPNADLKVKLHDENFPLALLTYRLTELTVVGIDTLDFGDQQRECFRVHYKLTSATGPDPAYNQYHWCDAWFSSGIGVIRVEERNLKGVLVRYTERLAP